MKQCLIEPINKHHDWISSCQTCVVVGVVLSLNTWIDLKSAHVVHSHAGETTAEKNNKQPLTSEMENMSQPFQK